MSGSVSLCLEVPPLPVPLREGSVHMGDSLSDTLVNKPKTSTIIIPLDDEETKTKRD